MAPGLLADIVLVTHAGIVAFVVGGQVAFMLGGRLGWRWVRSFALRLVHLLLVLFIAAQTWLGQWCPLTIWEQDLRAAAGETTHGESFIGHWLGRLLYFELPAWAFVVGYSAFLALVLVTWWRVPPRRRLGSPARR